MTTNGHTELHYQVVNVADTETIEKSKKIVVSRSSFNPSTTGLEYIHF